MPTLLIILILGLAFIFSMLGLGGAMVYNPLMVWFGFDFKAVVAPTGLLLNGLTAASAAWVYYRKGMIDWHAGLPLMLTATVGALLGAYVSQFVPTTWLMWAFAAAVLFAAVRMLISSGAAEPEAARGSRRQRAGWGAILGLGIGFVAGLLGIGGGFLIVPLLIFMGYPTKVAAATSAMAVAFSSFSGFLGHVAIGHVDWLLMLPAAVAVIIGSQAGARVMHGYMKPRHIKQMFGVILLLIVAKWVWGLVV